ncbi:hypothetical protein Tco_0931381 [Tanacetum coccineum]
MDGVGEVGEGRGLVVVDGRGVRDERAECRGLVFVRLAAGVSALLHCSEVLTNAWGSVYVGIIADQTHTTGPSTSRGAQRPRADARAVLSDRTCVLAVDFCLRARGESGLLGLSGAGFFGTTYQLVSLCPPPPTCTTVPPTAQNAGIPRASGSSGTWTDGFIMCSSQWRRLVRPAEADRSRGTVKIQQGRDVIRTETGYERSGQGRTRERSGSGDCPGTEPERSREWSRGRGDVCAPKCNNCKKVGHLARNYRSPAATANNQRAPGVIQRVISCFECLFDESLVILLDEIHIDDKLYFVKEPVEIMDHEVKRLKKSRIPIIKV